MYGVDGSLRIHCFAAVEDAEPTTLATLGGTSDFVDPGGRNEKKEKDETKGSRANIPLCPHSGTTAVSGRPHLTVNQQFTTCLCAPQARLG